MIFTPGDNVMCSWDSGEEGETIMWSVDTDGLLMQNIVYSCNLTPLIKSVAFFEELF